MTPDILVTTRWEAADLNAEFDSVLTVFSPWWYCDWGHPDHLHVEFADRVAYDEGAPTYDQIWAIAGWASERLNNRILVNCKAGQSRSIATAIGIYCIAGMTEEDAWDHVYWNCRPKDKVGNRPFIPNPRILEHFDAILGTDLVGISPRARELEWAS